MQAPLGEPQGGDGSKEGRESGCCRGWNFAGRWGEVTKLRMESVEGSIADGAVRNPRCSSGN